ncbi:hypothetical protein C9374_002775 [Naegleria lovaniensis]|uniref:GH18 domain-containing protein n=1 Tax=Naegleria lovaniensis TaxID=51637 RepID=A0AA88GV81_NAELO|nr:uncharacterized protein C9374_002775 [Naegleria lovaniensis]KAG2386329.1 hypothetical protein C9374_002775 [Naegleria lovaniensis]
MSFHHVQLSAAVVIIVTLCSLSVINALSLKTSSITTTTTTSSSNKQILYWMGLERTHENITQDLNSLLQRSSQGQLTQISYEAYNLGPASSFVDNHFYNVLPILKSSNQLKELYPMITTVNIPYLTDLLSNETSMDKFIKQAIQNEKLIQATGYNIDFEPDRNDASTRLAPSFAVFLNRFADALHAIGRKLTVCVASWSYFWDIKLIAQTRVDRVITMDTYAVKQDEFNSAFQRALSYIPVSKLGLGLMYDARVDVQELRRRIDMILKAGITEIDVWQYQGTSDMWFSELQQGFLLQ